MASLSKKIQDSDDDDDLSLTKLREKLHDNEDSISLSELKQKLKSGGNCPENDNITLSNKLTRKQQGTNEQRLIDRGQHATDEPSEEDIPLKELLRTCQGKMGKQGKKITLENQSNEMLNHTVDHADYFKSTGESEVSSLSVTQSETVESEGVLVADLCFERVSERDTEHLMEMDCLI
jgi:hypothetical protein